MIIISNVMTNMITFMQRHSPVLHARTDFRVQEQCESRGGRSGLSVLMSLVDVKQHRTMPTHWSQFVPNISTDNRGHDALHHHCTD